MADELNEGISRRTALKRIGAGTAIAWSAPVLLSARAAAGAGSPGTECQKDAPCSNTSICNEELQCRCHFTIEGGTFCDFGWQFCGTGAVCTSTAECPPGTACLVSCCTAGGFGECIPACGAGGAGGAGGGGATDL
jgi:hypothetical protein